MATLQRSAINVFAADDKAFPSFRSLPALLSVTARRINAMTSAKAVTWHQQTFLLGRYPLQIPATRSLSLREFAETVAAGFPSTIVSQQWKGHAADTSRYTKGMVYLDQDNN
jgi:hypothetical protein